MITSETKLTVRYAETDQMGIVHHSNYPIWYEAARTDFIKSIGMPYSKIEEKGALLPLIELKCSYLSSAKYEDELLIKTSVKEFTYTRLTFYYEVYKMNQNELINRGETAHVWTTKELKPVNIKKYMPEIYELLKKINE
ncbi:MAG: acyl-CoA thioesterase [Clostridia bacterium]|nr:acyl-CoA thioesterase [Clostridia bacterium]